MTNFQKVDELINTLSSDERTNFIQFSKALGDAKTPALKVFQAIIKNDKSCEEIINRNFGKLPPRNKKLTAQSLFDKILDFLRLSYVRKKHEAKSNDVEIDISIDLINNQILKKRGLYEQVREVLHLAKEKAAQYDKQNIVLEILRKELNLVLSYEKKKLSEQIKQLNKDLKWQIKVVEKEYDYVILFNELSVLIRERPSNPIGFEQRLKNIKSSRLLEEPPKSLASVKNNKNNQIDQEDAFYSKYMFFYIRYYICLLEEDYPNSSLYIKRVLDIWRNTPHKIQEDPQRLIIYLANYLNSLHLINDYAPFQSIIDEAYAISLQTFDEKAERFQSIDFFKLIKLLNTTNFNQPKAAYKNEIMRLQGFIKDVEKYQKKLNKAREVNFNYCISIAWFLMDHFDKAEAYIQKIIQEKHDHRKDIQRFADIFQLFIFLEDQGASLAHSYFIKKIQSARKKISRQAPLSSYEKCLFKHLLRLVRTKEAYSQAMKTEQSKEISKTLMDFKENLMEYEDSNELGREEIEIWLDKSLEMYK